MNGALVMEPAQSSAPSAPDWGDWKFPDDKSKIRRLSVDDKMTWYGYRIQKAAELNQIAIELTTPEFQRFWKWNVLIPLKIKRAIYRFKTGQMFKRYQHITEMRPKVKKHGI